MTDESTPRRIDSPVGGLDEIMNRAAGGRVAVVERGGEPKIIGKPQSESKDASKTEESNGGNGAEEKKEEPAAAASEAASEETKESAEAGSEAQKQEESPRPPEGPQPVPLDQGDADQIRESLQAMRELEAKLAAARIQYRQAEDELIEKRKTAQTELNATVKSIAKRNKVPDGWMVNLDLMQFEPPRRQPFPFTRR